MSTWLSDGSGHRINVGGGDLLVSQASPLVANPAGDIRVSVWAPDKSLLFKVDASSDLVGGQTSYEDTPSGCGAGSIALGLRYEERLARGYWQGGNLVEIFAGDNVLIDAIAGCSAGGTQKLYLDTTYLLDPAQGEDQQVLYMWDGANLTMQLPVVATSTTAAITHSATAQSVPVASSALFTVGNQFSIGVGANCETVTITAIPDGTHIKGIFTQSHLLGEVLTSIGADSNGPYVVVTTPLYGGGIPAYGALSTTVGRRRYQGRIERCSQVDQKSPNGTITLVGMSKAFSQAVGSVTITTAAAIDVGAAIYGELSQLAPGHWPFFGYNTAYEGTVNPGLFGVVGTIYGNTLTNVGADRMISDALGAIPLDTWVVRVGHDLIPRMMKLYDGTLQTYTYNVALNQAATMFWPVTVEVDDEDISNAFNAVLVTGDQDPTTKQPFAAIVDDAESLTFFGYQIDAQPVSNTACKSVAACAAYGQGQLNQNSGPVANQKFVVYTRHDYPNSTGPGGALQGDIVRAVACISVTGFQSTAIATPPSTSLTAAITTTGKQAASVLSTGLLQNGMYVTVGTGGGAEVVEILSINSSTSFTAIFANTHGNGAPVVGPSTYTPPNIYGLGVSVVSKIDFSKIDRWQEVQFQAIEPNWAAILNERANALAQAILSNTLTGAGLDQYFVSQTAYQGITYSTSSLVVTVPQFEAVFALGSNPVICGGNSFTMPASSTQWVWLIAPSTTTTTASITHGAGVQSAAVASTGGMIAGQQVIMDPGGTNQETVTVVAVVDATHFTGVFTKDHASGITVETNGGAWNLQNGPATQVGQILFAIVTANANGVLNLQPKAALGLLGILPTYLIGGVAYTPAVTGITLGTPMKSQLISQQTVSFEVTNQPTDQSYAKMIYYYRQHGQPYWLVLGTDVPRGALFSTTTTQSITSSGSPQSVSCVSTAGMEVGVGYVVDTGASQETVICTAIADNTHFSAIFTNNHSNGTAVTGAALGVRLQGGATSATGFYQVTFPDSINGVSYDLGFAMQSVVGTETAVVTLESGLISSIGVPTGVHLVMYAANVTETLTSQYPASPPMGTPPSTVVLALTFPWAVAYTDITNAITSSGSPQNVAVGGSFGAGAYAGFGNTSSLSVGQSVVIEAGTARQETVVITAIADSTHFSAIFTKNHLAGAFVSPTDSTWLANVQVACGWYDPSSPGPTQFLAQQPGGSLTGQLTCGATLSPNSTASPYFRYYMQLTAVAIDGSTLLQSILPYVFDPY